MPAVARDVRALLDHLGIARAHLLGYSMGGRLALYLALHESQRWHSLILESASPGLPTARERRARVEQDEALATFIEEQGIEQFVRRWEALPLFASQRSLPPAVRKAHRAARLRNRPAGLANSLRGMGTGRQPSLWGQLSALDLPTLLITGNLDQKFVTIARRMAACLPRARVEIVPHAGHTVHLERPQDYVDIVAGWLRQLDQYPTDAEQETPSRP
jgi:2-succinyl-6-hydroxy-2,4-cyclohexadiene-1-carboxylate synthase